MAALSSQAKVFIVTRLACFDSPSEVQTALKAELKVSATRSQIEAYNPTVAQGKRLGEKMRELFEDTRAAFLADTSSIPIANKAVRLRTLQRLADKAEGKGNSVLTASLLEQAAKEVGDSYSNRQKLDHAGVVGHVTVPAPSARAGQAQTAEDAYKLMLGGPR